MSNRFKEKQICPACKTHTLYHPTWNDIDYGNLKCSNPECDFSASTWWNEEEAEEIRKNVLTKVK